MFKKFAFFALFLAVVGLFAATSVDAQRLITRVTTKTEDVTTKTIEPVFSATEPEVNASISLSQCENGGVGKPVENCGAAGTDTNWNTGNMNGQKAHYQEGRSIHYRAVFGNLQTSPTRTYTVVLGYDITKGSPNIHAIDYLNNYNADIGTPVYTVTPCGSLVNSAGHPCQSNTSVQIPIPNDPDVPDSIEPPAGRFITVWGIQAGATASLSYGTSAERLITITFTPTVSNPVFGWSGHIALGSAWQAYNGGTGAGSISGSPYHMYNRGGGVNDFSGAQDLQLATSAITQPSAAGATVAGRVTDAYGRAITSAKLTIYDASTGDFQVVYTNTFGYYKFEDLPVGDFYVMSVEHRKYLFMNGSVSFTLEDSLDSMNFQASR